jgi:hypothetical protein
MGWTRVRVLRFTHQASASAARRELTGPDRRSLIPVTPAHPSIRCLAFPAAIRPRQWIYLGKQATKEQNGPRHAGFRDTLPVIAGGLREKLRISIVRDQ